MSTKDFDKQPALTGYQYGIAGAATGTITRFLVQPLDVLKIRFQAVKTIVREEGAHGLWKGHIPAQFLSVVFGAVQFSTYEMLSKYLYSSHPLSYTSYEHLVNIGCGSVAGLMATVTSFPFDVIKTHLVYQKEPKVYKGTLDAVRKIYGSEGPRGFTKGLMAASIQMMPMSGLVFFFHGMFTQFWFLLFQDPDSSGKLIISTTGSMTTGLFAGLCAKTVVYPFDLMKKRLQVQGFKESGSSSCKEMIVCRTISQCFTLTVRNEGFLGLFKGFMPTLIKSGTTTSLYFTIYDKICSFMQYSLAKR